MAVAEALLAAGAEVNAKTMETDKYESKTPLDVAKSSEMKALLTQHDGKQFNELEER